MVRRLLLGVMLLPWLAGCGTLSFYSQAVQGQWEILARRRPLASVLEDAATPATLAERLRLVQAMRRFAVERLALPDGGSYGGYADLGRSHAVWVVYAAPRFSLIPVRWCYPLVGCLNYRGYFAREDGVALGRELEQAGHDVHVAGVHAYSTLGWFEDPLLNTYIYWDEGQLAELIFHELAHERLYVAGRTEFNEGYAEVVGRRGVELWLEGRQEALARVRGYWREREVLERVVEEARVALEGVYGRGGEGMEEAKGRILEQARERYGRESGAGGRYGGWMAGLNNARIVSLATYGRWVPGLTALYRRVGGMEAFHREVEALAEMEDGAWEARLELEAAGR